MLEGARETTHGPLVTHTQPIELLAAWRESQANQV
jgi:hypothetical protein